MRTITLLALLLATPALADDPAPDPLVDLERTATERLVASHRSLARWCEGRGLRTHACRHWREVLWLRPDDKTARRALHYQRDADTWKPTKDYDTRDRRKGASRARAVKALEAKLRTHHAIGTNAWSTLAAKADELGRKTARHRYLWRVLAHDRDHGGARDLLGYRRGARGQWVDKGLIDRLTTMDAGKVIDAKRPLEAGLTLYKRRGAHFELGHFRSDAWTATLMQHAELAYTAFGDWTKPTREPLRADDPLIIYSLRTPDYQRVIQQHSQTSQQIKDHCKRCSSAHIRGTPVFANQIFDRDTEATELDRIVYLAGRNVVFYLAGGGKSAPPWLREGMAWELTLRILGTRYHAAVTLSDGTSSRIEDKRWSDTTRWPDYLRELVLLDRAPSIATLLKAASVNDIRDADAALAWSLTCYLLERDGKAVGAFLEALATGATPEAALRQSLDTDAAALQAAWRAWVLERY